MMESILLFFFNPYSLVAVFDDICVSSGSEEQCQAVTSLWKTFQLTIIAYLLFLSRT